MPRKSYTRRMYPGMWKCIACGRLYPAYRTDSRTCSGACRQRVWRRSQKAKLDYLRKLASTVPGLS